MRRAPWLGIVLASNALLALIACGSRTGFLDDETALVPDDASFVDVHHPTADATSDVFVPPDALPPIDGRPIFDVQRNDCPDAAATLVYLISGDNVLFSFNPPTLALAEIGQIACPSSSTPYSMAVNRKGTAYVVFQSGELFKVSTGTAACTATPYAPGQFGFTTFGMGFVSDTGGAAETLFVAEGSAMPGSPSSRGLAKIDTTTFKLGFIGAFKPPQQHLEFTGTGDGRLFGFNPQVTGASIVQVDKTNANILASDPVPVNDNGAFAFAFWGGDFYMFIGPQSGAPTTNVYRYRPSDKSTALVTSFPTQIVGAGVSTCAPQ
jgi:hypothetical protein